MTLKNRAIEIKNETAVDANTAIRVGSLLEDMVDELDNKIQNPMEAAGDMIYGGINGAPERLSLGDENDVLTLVGGVPTWTELTLPEPPGILWEEDGPSHIQPKDSKHLSLPNFSGSPGDPDLMLLVDADGHVILGGEPGSPTAGDEDIINTADGAGGFKITDLKGILNEISHKDEVNSKISFLTNLLSLVNPVLIDLAAPEIILDSASPKLQEAFEPSHNDHITNKKYVDDKWQDSGLIVGHGTAYMTSGNELDISLETNNVLINTPNNFDAHLPIPNTILNAEMVVRKMSSNAYSVSATVGSASIIFNNQYSDLGITTTDEGAWIRVKAVQISANVINWIVIEHGGIWELQSPQSL